MKKTRQKFSDYTDVSQVAANDVYNELMRVLSNDKKKLLLDFRIKYRNFCENRQRLYDLENYEECVGFLYEFEKGNLE